MNCEEARVASIFYAARGHSATFGEKSIYKPTFKNYAQTYKNNDLFCK